MVGKSLCLVPPLPPPSPQSFFRCSGQARSASDSHEMAMSLYACCPAGAWAELEQSGGAGKGARGPALGAAAWWVGGGGAWGSLARRRGPWAGGRGWLLVGSASPHLQNVGQDHSWPQFPHLYTRGEFELCNSYDPAPSSEASRLGVGIRDLLGGGMGWEAWDLLGRYCQSLPPCLSTFRIQEGLFCSE